jgi:aldose 1-epimerase
VKVFTDQPGLQIYTANYWDGSLTGYQGVSYQQHGAIAPKARGFADEPNHPNFTNTILRPGEEYQHETIYQFLTIYD